MNDPVLVDVVPTRAGAPHELAEDCYEASVRFSFGYRLTESLRAAILELAGMVGALDQHGTVGEMTSWRRSPTGSICPPGPSATG